MLRGKYTQLFFVLFATVFATVSFGGLAQAETSPGTAEVNSSDSVVVSGTDTSSVNVSSTSQSTTTVGASSDGEVTTPPVTQSDSGSTGDIPSLSNEPTANAEEATGQNDQVHSGSNPSDPANTTSTAPGSIGGGDGFGNIKLQHVNQIEDLLPLATKAHSGDSVPLQAPINTDKNLPAPISTTGNSVLNAVSGSGGGFGGKGLAVAAVGLGQINSTQVLIIFLALLMIVGSSFISYLRRSGFSHAPRSDDSMADTFSFDTPRVEIPVLFGLRTAPVFYVASRLQLNNIKRGGE